MSKTAAEILPETSLIKAPKDVFERFGDRFGFAADDVLQVLLKSVFKPSKPDESEFTNAEVGAALALCNRYGLDPFAKEIYIARMRGKVMSIIGIDGWLRILNSHSDEIDGLKTPYQYDDGGKLVSCTCILRLKGRAEPYEVAEFFGECARDTDPWKQFPHRMLRHKAIKETVRIAFGLGGLMDDDDFEFMKSSEERGSYLEAPSAPAVAAPNELGQLREVKARKRAPAAPEVRARNEALDADLKAKMATSSTAHAHEPEKWEEPVAARAPAPIQLSKATLWKDWLDLKSKFSDAQLAEIRSAAGVEFVNPSLSAEDLSRVLAAAKEYPK